MRKPNFAKCWQGIGENGILNTALRSEDWCIHLKSNLTVLNQMQYKHPQ